METIGQRLRTRRSYLRLRQQEIADKVGINQSTYAAYENERIKNIPRDIVDKLALALDCDVDWLLGSDNIILKGYPEELKTWLAKPEALNYVMTAYAKYLQDKIK